MKVDLLSFNTGERMWRHKDSLGWKCKKLRVAVHNFDLTMWQSVSSFKHVEGTEVQKETEFYFFFIFFFLGSRGSDMSPRRDAVWHQLYSTSHIYTEEREKDKTAFFLVDLYILQSHKKSWEHANGTLLLFLTPDNMPTKVCLVGAMVFSSSHVWETEF